MSDKPKKTCYHSELAAMGPVSVTVKSDVMQSKFAGKNDYVMLLIDGHERSYNCENDACAEFFEGQKGRTMTIVAEGSREEAVVVFVGEQMLEEPPPQEQRRANKPPPQQRQAAQARPPAQPATRTAPAKQNAVAPPQQRTAPPAKDPVTNARQFLGRRRNGYLLCLDAVVSIAAEYAERHPELTPLNPEQFQACTSTLFIEGARAGIFDALPTGPLPMPKLPAGEPSDNDGGVS